MPIRIPNTYDAVITTDRWSNTARIIFSRPPKKDIKDEILKLDNPQRGISSRELENISFGEDGEMTKMRSREFIIRGDRTYDSREMASHLQTELMRMFKLESKIMGMENDSLDSLIGITADSDDTWVTFLCDKIMDDYSDDYVAGYAEERYGLEVVWL